MVFRDEKRERRQPEMVIARSRGRHRQGIDCVNVHCDGEHGHSEAGEDDHDYCGDTGIDNIDDNFNYDLMFDSSCLQDGGGGGGGGGQTDALGAAGDLGEGEEGKGGGYDKI